MICPTCQNEKPDEKEVVRNKTKLGSFCSECYAAFGSRIIQGNGINYYIPGVNSDNRDLKTIALEALQFYADLRYDDKMGLPPEVQWVAEQAIRKINMKER